MCDTNKPAKAPCENPTWDIQWCCAAGTKMVKECFSCIWHWHAQIWFQYYYELHMLVCACKCESEVPLKEKKSPCRHCLVMSHISMTSWKELAWCCIFNHLARFYHISNVLAAFFWPRCFLQSSVCPRGLQFELGDICMCMLCILWYFVSDDVEARTLTWDISGAFPVPCDILLCLTI